MAATILDQPAWQALEAAHADRVDDLTAGHRSRRQVGTPHPVEDFLFTYYPFKPSQLRRWHPGPDVVLAGAAALDRGSWRFYTHDGHGGSRLDTTAYLAARGSTVDFVRRLVSATRERPAQLGCFGLHEWAMVYRQSPDDVRHAAWPLRLGADGTDQVVDGLQIRCTHFDAFRFYTPPARPLNLLQPTRADQVAVEQPGCLHAGMDLYKWCMKLAPAVPSSLVLDCFTLAREIRELDMRASPYDLSALGHDPVAIETPQGRAEYAAAQRDFAARGQGLRERLLQALDAVTGDYSTESVERASVLPEPVSSSARMR
ncbi:hypothetical protein SAMN04489867_0336 [Pedococcus dokdonensis]|uniref:3-methyladenine DNA glycosylase n=1 Tax=Pedococcus dokdonensis TaxID=443156 RepID=A0A1H0LMH2_9MICO|nr:3-methyladenine DNA glycosylase [Pedococcus dokdonensis]SDO69263.1 hypothetical protein SAMN04489867_0336 [Pedococcus dokdonensis]